MTSIAIYTIASRSSIVAVLVVMIAIINAFC